MEDVEDTPVNKPEVAHVDRDLDLRDPVEASVEPVGRHSLEPRFSGALFAHRVDDVVALPPAPRQLEHDVGRMLEVGIHQDDRVPCGQVGARCQCELVAEVAREPDEPEARILCR